MLSKKVDKNQVSQPSCRDMNINHVIRSFQSIPLHFILYVHGPTQSGEVTGSHILHKPQTSHNYSGTCVAMLYLLAEMTHTLLNCHTVYGNILYLLTCKHIDDINQFATLFLWQYTSEDDTATSHTYFQLLVKVPSPGSVGESHTHCPSVASLHQPKHQENHTRQLANWSSSRQA